MLVSELCADSFERKWGNNMNNVYCNLPCNRNVCVALVRTYIGRSDIEGSWNLWNNIFNRNRKRLIVIDDGRIEADFNATEKQKLSREQLYEFFDETLS